MSYSERVSCTGCQCAASCNPRRLLIMQMLYEAGLFKQHSLYWSDGNQRILFIHGESAYLPDGGPMLTRVSRDLSYSLRSCDALKLLFKSYNQSITDSITAISLSPLQSQPSPFTTTTSQRRPPSKPMMHIAY